MQSRLIKSKNFRRGSMFVYTIIGLPVFIAFCAMAVDIGRWQLAKSEAQAMADSAALYAAQGMVTSATPSDTALANAIAVGAGSTIDGSTFTFNSSSVTCGTFDSSSKTFTASATGNCVKVTVHQTLSRAGAPPLFMRIFFPSIAPQVDASAIAEAQTTTTTIFPPASGNLWLSGMPDNSTTQNMRPDNSTVWDSNGTASNPKQRPLEVDLSSANLHPGDTINLEGINGNASWENSSDGTNNGADGDSTYLVSNGSAPASSAPTNSNNGLSNVRAPIGAVMAVFLDDNAPNTSAAPTDLDFGTQAQRDYTSISPMLKQVFFVGDGKKSDGESQSIIVPNGATRVYFGMMDAWQWNDNVGTFNTNLYSSSKVWLVK